ncbi:MAG: cysteine hydrolase family protein [Candidatus Kryptoniota bacterium]
MEHNNNQNTALLVMDVQEATVNRLKDSAPLMNALKKAIETARNCKMPVIYAVVGFRKGYTEVSPNNKSFSTIKSGVMNFDSEEAARVHASVAPQPGDVIITKKRVSAFTGSDLEVVLRSLERKHLILSGIATSGVVLSTLREAADKDYAITVLSDCCADMDEEVHRILMTKVFPRQAEIISSDEWCSNNHP